MKLRFLLVFVLIAVGFFVMSIELAAADRIVYLPSMENKPEAVQGTIESVSGLHGLTIQTQSGTKVHVPFSRLCRIELESEPRLIAADELQAKASESNTHDDWRNAYSAYETIRNDTKVPVWLRQWITARMAECQFATDNMAQSAAEFLLLCRIDPYTPFLNHIPLVWTRSKTFVDPSSQMRLVQLLSPWLESKSNPSGRENPAARLLAASLLLDQSGPIRDKAIAALQDLVILANPDPSQSNLEDVCTQLSLLATAQLWRIKLTGALDEKEVDRWRLTIRRLPPAFRKGPWLLLEQGYQKVGNTPKAQQARDHF